MSDLTTQPSGANDEKALTHLAKQALAAWNLEVASLTLHAQRENTVFRVDTNSGGAYALRIHRDGYHGLPALISEHVWTAALADAGISVPVALRTRDNKEYASVRFPGTERTRHVGVVPWIPGISLGEHLGAHVDANEVRATYEALGRLTADLHLATAGWTPPPGFTRHAWDAEGLLGERPIWGRFWEIEAASDSERAQLSFIREALLRLLSAEPRDTELYGMIHADLNADNVLRDGEELSVIDFDDCGFGWHAFDLAVAVWDRMDVLSGGQFTPAYEGLVSGYRSRRDDCDRIVDQVPLFMLVRSLMLLGWMEDRPDTGFADMVPVLLEVALGQWEELDLV